MEQVIDYLSNYRMNTARAAYLDALITQAIKRYEHERNNDIEAASLGGSRPVGMPRGGGLSSPVERVTEQLEKGKATPMASELCEQIACMQRERDSLQMKTDCVAAWLGVLGAEERYVVEQKMITGCVWREVAQGYLNAFGIDLSKDTLKRMRERALQRMAQVAA